MGNATSSEVDKSADDGIVTVNTIANSCSQAQDDILETLRQLPQVKQASANKGLEDQLWRELTSYSQDQLQLDPQLTLRVLNTYKTWCKSQAQTVAQQQDFVNSRIHDVDKLATKVLQECARRHQKLQSMAQAFRLLAATEQMEELSGRLQACEDVMATARTQIAEDDGQSKS